MGCFPEINLKIGQVGRKQLRLAQHLALFPTQPRTGPMRDIFR